MPALAKLQTLFLEALKQNLSAESELLAQVKQATGLNNQSRLSIYKNNIFYSHLKALENSFPVTKKLVGEEFFRNLVRRYMKACPADQQDLHLYGRDFPGFIKAFLPTLGSTLEINYLSDLAKLEWCFYRAHFAKQDSDFDYQGFNHVPDEEKGQVQFKLNNSLKLIKSQFPIFEIWKDNLAEDENESQINLNKTSYGIIWADKLLVQVREISEREFKFIKLINKHCTLDQLAGACVELDLQLDRYILEFMGSRVITSWRKLL